jgi:hypothetical protein
LLDCCAVNDSCSAKVIFANEGREYVINLLARPGEKTTTDVTFALNQLMVHRCAA